MPTFSNLAKDERSVRKIGESTISDCVTIDPKTDGIHLPLTDVNGQPMLRVKDSKEQER